MNKINSIRLEPDMIDELRTFSPLKKFITSSPLFYAGQIPIVAYLLIDGSITLHKNKKIKKIVKPGCLIGLNELMANIPAQLSAQVLAESTLCFLDKSTIKEIIENHHSTLGDLLKEESE